MLRPFCLVLPILVTVAGAWVLNRGGGWAAPVPIGKPSLTEMTNSIGMSLASIPAGKFSMGSSKEEQDEAIADFEKFTGKKLFQPLIDSYRCEGPEQEVEITKGFYLGVYEVTQGEYLKVMKKNPSNFAKSGEGKDNVSEMDTSRFPVERVRYEDAVTFCKKLSERADEEKKKHVYRLPTEAEWEYACRGGVRPKSTFHRGKSLSSNQANFNGNHPYGGAGKGANLQRTCKVGSYRANGYGLYDMHGNVMEWCSDWYGGDYYGNSPARDPRGPTEGHFRVVRGGGWYNNGQDCRSAFRGIATPEHRGYDLGFRVALILSKE